MKRAKMMLGAIALFAIVGGGLAFKAKNFNSFRFYYSISPLGHCTSTTSIKATLTDPGLSLGAFDTQLYSTTYTTTCPALTLYTTE